MVTYHVLQVVISKCQVQFQPHAILLLIRQIEHLAAYVLNALFGFEDREALANGPRSIKPQLSYSFDPSVRVGLFILHLQYDGIKIVWRCSLSAIHPGSRRTHLDTKREKVKSQKKKKKKILFCCCCDKETKLSEHSNTLTFLVRRERIAFIMKLEVYLANLTLLSPCTQLMMKRSSWSPHPPPRRRPSFVCLYKCNSVNNNNN